MYNSEKVSPRNFMHEQLRRFPQSIDLAECITKDIHAQVNELLLSNRIKISHTEFRLKPMPSIRDKYELFPYEPILDIFGMRFVLAEEKKEGAKSLILAKWPTPDRLYGIPTYREMGQKFRREATHNAYSAIHMNILFDDPNRISRIAEIQLFNRAEWEVAEATREYYEVERARLVKAKQDESANHI